MKSKRHVLRSIKDRLRARFNVSVAELSDQDTWQRSELGIAVIGTDKRGLNGTLSRISDLVSACPDAVVTDTMLEIF
ncbi:MAG: DUF503 domain-containing protein [Candidatus Omnitrophica bacterium]|nr:DUF503 domain-containing protein [Candidatus Omnitrophota bacterium]